MLAQHGWPRDTYRIEFQPAWKLAQSQESAQNESAILAADTMVFAIPRHCDPAYNDNPFNNVGGCEVVLFLDSNSRKVLQSLMTQ